MARPEVVAARFRLALELSALGEAMFRQRMRWKHPELDEGGIDDLVVAWRQRRPGAEEGDAVGRPVRWPRGGA